MKKLLFALLLMPFMSLANPDSVKVDSIQMAQPFEKCNTIIVTTGLSDEEAYKVAGRGLVNAGYTIETANKDFYTIKSAMATTPKSNWNYYLTMSVSNGIIKIDGMIRDNISLSLWGVSTAINETKIQYVTAWGVNKEVKEIFPKMIELAKSLNPKIIEFEQR